MSSKHYMYAILIFAISLIISVSCNSVETPIVFTKETDQNLIKISLDTNKTFDYQAKHIKGVAFHEKGTYTIEDSLIILRYNNKSYSYNCYTIPLRNDTLLILNYKDTTYLYQIVTFDMIDSSFIPKHNLMMSIVTDYKQNFFNLFVDDKYFKHTSGSFNYLHKTKHKISKFYDKYLQK